MLLTLMPLSPLFQEALQETSAKELQDHGSSQPHSFVMMMIAISPYTERESVIFDIRSLLMSYPINPRGARPTRSQNLVCNSPKLLHLYNNNNNNNNNMTCINCEPISSIC